MTRSPSTHRFKARYRCVAGVIALLSASTLTGCVTFYQPLTSLQRPTVVDPRIANFEGVRLLVRCIPGDYLDRSDSNLLCRSVATTFRNQGADVEVEIPRPGRGSARESDEETRPDLIVDLKSRLLHKDGSNVLWVLSVATFTLVPTFTEYSIAQDVTVRDPSGSLLATDSLQARFIEYFGVGVWGVNWLLDLAVRPDEDELAGDAAKRDFSRDFYGQLSQLVFNARMRSVVLKGFDAPAVAPAPDAAPDGGEAGRAPAGRLDGKE